MVLSMLIAIIAAPGLLGSQEAIRQSQSQEKREEHRARRCNLIATCVKSSQRSREINGRPIVLRNGKLWIDTGTEDSLPLGHMYAGYYLPYPDEKYEGLVTTVTDVAPIMNWVYIDRETHEVKYGVRVDAQPNLTGPFNCTRQDRRLTFDGWEGFCAVEQAPGLWGLYFDIDDDGLKGKVAPGTRVFEIELSRREKRFQKETSARQQDQTTKRKVDVNEEAPFDEALGPEALVERPGVVGEGVESRMEDGVLEGSKEQAKPRPFRIPKSIFENPPPTLESDVFISVTPPPAYERTESPGAPAVLPSAIDDFVQTAFPLPEDAQDPSTQSTQTSTNVPRLDEGISQLDISKSLSPERSRNRSTSPAASQTIASGDINTTPKLNRSNGTRALAQAQMFEAMAAGQKSKGNVRQSSANRGSRASSASEYSRDSQDKVEEIEKGDIRAPSPPHILPLAPSKSRKDVSNSKPTAERLKTPPRQRALTNPKDPAVFSTEARRAVGNREPIRRPSQSISKPATRPSVLRSTSQASPRVPSQRQGTAPVQTAESSSPRASPQLNRRGSRGSLTATMTSGRGNRGMTTRIVGSEERGRPVRSATLQGTSRTVAGRKTTSALFREIDELVSQDGGGNGMKN